VTGYDKSPDYGGPPFSWWSVALTAVIMCAALAGLIWAAL
jgi:hypothetical protein